MHRKPLAGIHRVRMKLKGNRVIFYHYAWRGGPRFWSSDSDVKEGSAQYVAAFGEAGKQAQDKSGKFRDIIRMYMASTNFTRLSPRSQKDIRYSLFRENGIDDKFGDAPIGAFNRPKIRQTALKWRDTYHGRQADMVFAHLKQIISWALDRGYLLEHHLRGGGKVYTKSRNDIIWTEPEIDSFVSGTPDYVGRILIAETETGLRPGDLFNLSRFHIQKTPKGRRIYMRTSKRGRIVSIPITPRMAEIIDNLPATQERILVNGAGEPFAHQNSLGQTVHKWRDKLKLRKDLRLYDGRGTAATRLLNSGATLNQIALAMGWSIRDAAQMIETYATLNPDNSDAILVKLNSAKTGTKL